MSSRGKIWQASMGLLVPLMLAAGAQSAQAADRVLLIGIDDHADKSLNLKSGTPASNDVDAIHLMLITKLKYSDKSIRILKNEQATAAGIRAAFNDWLVKGSNPGDRIYIYYSGNGYFTADKNGDEADGLDEGFVPYDARPSQRNGKLAIDGLVIDDELTTLFSQLKGRKITLVVDAGFSGRVTRKKGGETTGDQRLPQVGGTTRSISVEPRVATQKGEGGYLDKVPGGVHVSAWTGVSASQTALIYNGDPSHKGGVFTKLYLEGIAEGRADRNKNGSVSNPELFTYLSEGSAKYCKSHGGSCEMGLTPRLEPPGAHAYTAYGTTIAAHTPAGPAPVEPGPAPANKYGVTPTVIGDYISKGNHDGIGVRQIPAGPVYVGQKDIRFVITSPHDGYLILLNLTDKGELYQLYPNQFSRKRQDHGFLRAGAPLMVPDDYYGLRFNATAPSTGQIIAIVSRRKIDWDKAVGTRSIEVIPRQEAVQTFLPKIAAVLGQPAATPDPATNTQAMKWSVVTMRYAIKPR